MYQLFNCIILINIELQYIMIFLKYR